MNVNLGVVVNNFAAPVQSDHKLDECLWHNVDEIGTELNEEPKKGTFVLSKQYSDVFAQSSSDFGRISNLEHEIHTGNSTAVKQAICRLSPHQRHEVQKLLHIMLNEGVDQPSESPWASLFMLVLKKDNSFLFCIDYYKLLRLFIKMPTH